MSDTVHRIDRTLDVLTARLLARRNSSGVWEGKLASSALSTATAAIALTLAERAAGGMYTRLTGRGRRWLVDHQNEDGGWGDTVLNFSNLSTSALCWSALSLDPAAVEQERHAAARAERYLERQIGDLSAERIRTAIVGRYGKDRTFSAPILTVLALAGRLGTPGDAWRIVPQLPFELAACPHRWFQWLRLPVVSYALPALVAIGQVRHHHAPSRNPALRRIRSSLRPRTLKTALEMQPASGGYLEATPLTAFVVMSLIAAGTAGHPIVDQGVRFLAASARDDGSWPIDTNLSTWVTTLAVNAIGVRQPIGGSESRAILDWLLDQQVGSEHPFTHAAPGGWAWTNLSGGVPDADDTAGALIAIRNLSTVDPRARPAAVAGLSWLLGLQNRDGGIPTFCRGWGALPFDRSAPDLTAHALTAWSVWASEIGPQLQRRLQDASTRAVKYLAKSQSADGSWTPLWFGNQHVTGEANLTYGTSNVLHALDSELARRASSTRSMRTRGIEWLMDAQNRDGGWGGAAGAPSSIEETGLALHALASGLGAHLDTRVIPAVVRGAEWIVRASHEGHDTPPSPIGLYFARLWYFEEMYPLVFGVGGLSAARALLSSARADAV
jgi:squalene-hopene/tetraprenyl-beta-curcumene cyclase